MTDQDKIKEMTRLVEAAKAALKEAENFADEHSLVFNWDNTTCSRKQDYVGKGHSLEGYKWDIRKNEKSKGEWVSSSDMCD